MVKNGFDFNSNEGVIDPVPGGVSAVTATPPLASSGGATPNIALSGADILDWASRQLLNTSGDPVLNWQNYITQNITRIPAVAGPSSIDINGHYLGIDSQTDVDNENIKVFNLTMQFDPNGHNKRFGLNSDGGLFGINLYATHFASGNVGYYRGINIGSDFGLNSGAATAVMNNANDIGVYTNFRKGYTVNTYQGIGLFQNFDALSNLGQYEGIRISPNVYANGVTGVLGLTIAMNISSTVSGGINMIQTQSGFSGTAGYYVDVQTGSNMNAGANISGQYTGINVSPVIDAAASINQYVGVNVVPNASTMTTGNVLGIVVDLGNISSVNRKIGLSVGNGFMNSYVQLETQSSLFIDIGNQHTHTFHVASGSPVTGTDVFLNNHTSQMFAEDNFTSGPLGLGAVGTATTSQFSVTSGKTLDRVSQFLVGASSPPIVGDGGTITDYSGLSFFGALNFGGNLSITNQYAFRVEDNSAGYAANYWGIYVDDPNSENYFKKSIVIGGATKKVTNASIGFEIASKKALKLTPMTVAEMNALTAAEGMFVSISDGATHEPRYYDGTSWRTVVLA